MEILDSKPNIQGRITLVNDVFMMILPFLNLIDLSRCEQVNRQMNKFLQSPFVWRNIVDDIERNVEDSFSGFHKWIIKRIKLFKPRRLILYDSLSNWRYDEILEIFSEPNTNLKKLDIRYDCDHEQRADILVSTIVVNCPNLISFKTHGKFLTDSNFTSFRKLTQLEVLCIYIDDAGFKGKNLDLLPPLRKIFLRPHRIKYSRVKGLIEKSAPYIEKIALDCENLAAEEVYNVVSKLNPEKLKKLLLTFCEGMNNDVFGTFQKFRKLQKLKFEKGFQISEQCFFNTFSLLD